MTPKFDGQEIFCDSKKMDPISWFRKFELKLQLHHTSEEKKHTYLYSRSGGACQALLDNLLSKYRVVAADLYTKISWDDLKATWHERFQIEPLDKLLTFQQRTLPSGDWIVESQRLASTLEVPMGFTAIKHHFITRSCPTLSNAWTHVVETLTITVELFDKGAQIIVMNTEAKNLPCSSAADPIREQHRLKEAVVTAATLTDWSLPRIDDLLERLGGAKYFFKLDLKSGYHQILIRPNDRYKSAFKMRYKHFEWVVVPFGLTNAPMTFQAAMTNEFHAMLDRFVLVYLDDILVYSRTLEDHLEHLRRVLETLRRAKYKATPLSNKIQAIKEWPESRNITDVCSFLDLAGYYQRFIKGYLKIMAHLTKLQCEDRPFDFGEDARESFLALKTALLSAEVLRIYNPLLLMRVTTDASDYGIGAVLEQRHGMD
ncbi:hypothetical protein CBR_g50004 [Chara braunii]|uniref:Reverse transcriptase domain-containing protein n=1 Tax=Chara braunii TaxID=69332 RepID=A0A388K5J1_CHABU|nr:hypothetical protein CBR_g50004 [Chara braunii]|eukprot:GBG65213.1 hypothetical protein CBR_g50004 [Chara braunii]